MCVKTFTARVKVKARMDVTVGGCAIAATSIEMAFYWPA